MGGGSLLLGEGTNALERILSRAKRHRSILKLPAPIGRQVGLRAASPRILGSEQMAPLERILSRAT